MPAPVFDNMLHQQDHLPLGSDAIIDWQLWYVEPLSPAVTPADYDSGNEWNTTWEGSWQNISSDFPATGYSKVVGGKTYMQIAATGDEATPNSLMFVLPDMFWPDTIRPIIIACGTDGQSLGLINVLPNGSVIFVGELSTLV